MKVSTRIQLATVLQVCGLLVLALDMIEMPIALHRDGIKTFCGLACGIEFSIMIGVLLIACASVFLGLAKWIGRKPIWAWPYFWTLIAVMILQDVTLVVLAERMGEPNW